jgi:hypothetical protein
MHVLKGISDKVKASTMMTQILVASSSFIRSGLQWWKTLVWMDHTRPTNHSAAVVSQSFVLKMQPLLVQCEQCDNVKFVREEDTLTVQVDPGMRDGQVATLS